ncbi:hypothetical protein SeMB42_g06443 [Synchytrium endobioticum]|uniref:Uncharacterized protein n=1 Tax=Synchytrium endobioticum TaxID=286115 RepID=A0A507CLQ8_9FUNG|nr:hypothetical protein SeMB42_g06443 [Synchytrium endobioticum]TPX41213.1 hypothetical protein SeLEV6574_g06204 [Synchytrium endobioticum]
MAEHDAVSRPLPVPLPSKLGPLGANKLTRWIKQKANQDYYLISLALTAIAFRLSRRANAYLFDRVDDLPRTPWDSGRNYTVTDINNMLTGYGSLGREVYSAVCLTDSLFVLTREASIMLTQFSFWTYAPAQWTPEFLFILTFVIGVTIDLTENIAGWISVSQFPHVDPFWANLICQANEAKWIWSYVEIAIVSFGFLVSAFYKAPKLQKMLAEFLWPDAAARGGASEAEAARKNDGDASEGIVKGSMSNGHASSKATRKKPGNMETGSPRQRKVITK